MVKWIAVTVVGLMSYVFVMRLLWAPIEKFLNKKEWGPDYERKDSAQALSAVWPLLIVASPVICMAIFPFKLAERLSRGPADTPNEQAEAPMPIPPTIPTTPQMTEIAQALKITPMVYRASCGCDSYGSTCHDAHLSGKSHI